jgi:hypothetical protein
MSNIIPYFFGSYSEFVKILSDLIINNTPMEEWLQSFSITESLTEFNYKNLKII